MQLHFLDWFFILLSIVMIAGIRFVKPVSSFNDNYLSKENCNIIRGFIVFVPPITHLCNRGVGFNEAVTDYTTVIVAFFFFFTGYGLTKQHLLNDDYSRKYLIKRLPKIVIPYIFATLAFVVVDFFFLGFLYPIGGILNAIKCGDPIVIASWYVIHIIAFYIWFWFMMKICRKNRLLLVFAAILYYVLTTLFCMKMGWGSHWWGTSYGLFIGVAWAAYEKEIVGFCKKYYLYVLIGISALTILYQMFGPGQYIKFSLGLITVIVLLMRINLKNPLLSFCGKISFEMYMIHGCFLVMGRCDRFYIESEPLYVLFVIGGTIIAGALFWYVDRFVLKWFDKGLKAVKLL